MDLQLRAKIAIVTGASRGIGKSIAERLATEGMRLVLAARSGDLLSALAANCASQALAFPCDLRDPASPQALVDFAVDRFGGVDVLVNNAGATLRGDFLKLADDDWQEGFALKFYGAMRCARAAWPHLTRSRGAIVNIVGVGGRTASAEFTIGGSVNAALLNLTKALSDRGIVDGVRINAINPGSILTERLTSRISTLANDRGISTEAAASELVGKLGIERFGTPSDIANAVAFLVSPMSAYCQGSILDMDGGQTRTL